MATRKLKIQFFIIHPISLSYEPTQASLLPAGSVLSGFGASVLQHSFSV